MKVLQKDIIAISPGESKTFTVDHPKDFYSIKTLCYIARNRHPELGVKIFSTSVDIVRNKITITAIPVESKNQ